MTSSNGNIYALLAICAENSQVIDEFTAQRPMMRSFDVFCIRAIISGWVNNGETGDLRHHLEYVEVTHSHPN